MKRLIVIIFSLLLVFSGVIGGQETTEQKLIKYKKWFDQKIISKEEYDQLKKKALEQVDTEKEEVVAYCDYVGNKIKNWDTLKFRSYSPNANAQRIVKEILDAAGLAPNFIVTAMNVPNAAAVIWKNQRYIAYNTEFINKIKQGTSTNWSVYSVMAHEIGHHLSGHTLLPGGSRPAQELEADEYSGFILYKLGSTLDQAKICMQVFASEQGSSTHPPKAERVVAIAKGWNKARGQGAQPSAGTTSPTSAGPVSTRPTQPTQQERSPVNNPPRTVPAQTTRIQLVYTGDAYSCTLNLTIRIGSKVVVPDSNHFVVDGITPGRNSYQVSGMISCPALGSCNAAGQGTLFVSPNDTYYVRWQNTSYGNCTVGLFKY